MTDTCDKKVYEDGRSLCWLELDKKRMEKFVRAVRKRSKQQVDWHYYGGRAVIKYLGDQERVVRVMHDEGLLYLKLKQEYLSESKYWNGINGISGPCWLEEWSMRVSVP